MWKIVRTALRGISAGAQCADANPVRHRLTTDCVFLGRSIFTGSACRTIPLRAAGVYAQPAAVDIPRVPYAQRAGPCREPASLHGGCRWGPIPRARLTALEGNTGHEAHVPAEQPSSAQEARLPPAHAYPCGPLDSFVASQQGPFPPHGLTCSPVTSVSTPARACGRRSATGSGRAPAASWCILWPIGRTPMPQSSWVRVLARPSSGTGGSAKSDMRWRGCGTSSPAART